MVWAAFGWPDAAPHAKSDDASEEDYPECDYDTNLTPLYEAIEERAWIAVNQFLHSGYWPESLFADKMSPEDQARTWVTRYETRPDGSKKVRWSQLPIHAAVIFGAPSVVIQQLVEAFPQSVRCTDDHRMLPLHLAFRHGSDDSVLALFLEEFPEAVNVRGYKGRLPVDCAQKGPNPERGAIIQTILQKNQSAWERKKSAVQLKELYCIKEALKIKSQKVSHLETAIREIKSREHKTRKELASTMTELKAAKIKSKDAEDNNAQQDTSAEREAVKQLVEKLAALEMATKDLVDKERTTKQELKKTIEELEATKKLKPTDDQAEQFAKLEKVASKESNLLDRSQEASQQRPSIKRAGSKVSFDERDGEAKKEASSRSIGAPMSILKKAAETAKKVTGKRSNKKEAKEAKDANEAMKVKESDKTKMVRKHESNVEVVPKTTKDNKGEDSIIEVVARSIRDGKDAASKSSCKDKLVKEAAETTGGKAGEVTSERGSVWKPANKTKDTKKMMEANADVQEPNDFEKKNSSQVVEEGGTKEAKENGMKAKAKESAAEGMEEKTSVDFREGPEENAPRDTTEGRTKKATKDRKAMQDFEEAKDNPTSTDVLEQKEKEAWGNKKTSSDAKKANKRASKGATQDANKSRGAKLKGVKEGKETKAKTKATNDVNRDDTAHAATKKANQVPPVIQQSESRELEKQKLRKVEEMNMALEKKIANLEAQKLHKEEDANLALEKKIAVLESDQQEKSKLRKVEEANVVLKKKIAALETAMKVYEAKTTRAQEELEAISVPDRYNQFTEQQTEQMSSIQAEMKALKQHSDNTKLELEAALRKLDELRSQQDARATAAQMEKTRMSEEAQKTNTKLEKKVALLELALQQFQEKSSVAKEEMKNIKDTITADKQVKLTPSQERHMLRLEEAMRKLEKNAKKTKKELDSALGELEEMKVKEKESLTKQAAAEQEKFRSVEQTNRELEEKIALLESTMKQFEDKANKTRAEMNQALEELKASDASTVASGESLKLTKKQKQHMAALEAAMRKLEERAHVTKKQLDEAVEELGDLKKAEEFAYVKTEGISKKENKAMKDLAKKVQALQAAMVGFEVKETKTMQDLEKTMRQLEEASNKRFEVLTATAEQSQVLATDNQFNKEVAKLEKRATKEEKKLVELEQAVQDIITKGGYTKEELDRTKALLGELQAKQQQQDPPQTKEEKEEAKQDKKLIKELTKKVATLQSAVIGFEVKETRTMKELEHTMKQLEELTSKRFEVLEKASAMKEKDTEKLAAAGALAEEKVAALHTAMRELEQNAAKTHEELEKAKLELETMRAANISSDGINKKIISSQEGQIKELNEKITVLQKAVMGFEVKETKTMQELEQTMKQLEELTAKRFEVLQKVAGREIEAAKAAEATKYSQKAAQEEKKVAALEFAMRELESKAYKTKLELERTMKGLEHLEEKQTVSQQEAAGVSKEEKRVMRELVSHVADIQEAVMAYDEKEHKTNQELEKTRRELEATKREVEELRAQQSAAATEKQLEAEIQVIATDDDQSQVEAVEVNDNEEPQESKEATETAKRVTEETLTSLETAIHRLVERLGTEDEMDNAKTVTVAEKIAAALSKEEAVTPVASNDEKFLPRPVSEENIVPAVSKEELNCASTPSSVSREASVADPEPQSAIQPVTSPIDPAEHSKPAVELPTIVPARTQERKDRKPGIAESVVEPEKPERRRASFFGRLSSKGQKESARKHAKKPKKRFSLFGSRKSSNGRSNGSAQHGDLPATSIVTTEQRKAVEAIHGPEIAAVLTDKQILDIHNKMKAAPAAAQEEVVPEEETAVEIMASLSGAERSFAGQSKADSVKSSGMKQEDPHMMIVSLPSQRSMKSLPSPHSDKNQKNGPISPISKKIGSVSPAPVSQPTIKQNKSVTDTKQKDLLVTAGTYDDGFEINF